MKRDNGLGTVYEMSDGRFRARASHQPDGTRPSLGVYDTEAEAQRAVLIGVHEIRGRRKTSVPTFEDFALTILDERELNGMRGVEHERQRFGKHIKSACFAKKPLDKIVPSDIAEWLRTMSRKHADDKRGERPRFLSGHTITRCLSLVCVIFNEAGPQERGIVEINPAMGMKVKRRSMETEDPWTFLSAEEQDRILRSPDIEDSERLPILFALGTGLRLGEQFNLELRDLHTTGEPRIVVRFGSKGKAPKNGKIRTVPLFGIGLEAARRWLDFLPKWCPHNYQRLVFPSIQGSRRGQKALGNGRFIPAPHGTHVMKSGKPVASSRGTHVYIDRLDLTMRAVHIERNIRWHDLRHSCASALVAGMWGEPWTLEEVKEMLGHSSILVTQRYAHLGQTALKKAATKVRWDRRESNPQPGA